MNSLNLKSRSDRIPRESRHPGRNAIAELKTVSALCELAASSQCRHKSVSMLVVLVASVILMPVLSFAQCAFLDGNWKAQTRAGKRLTLHIEQSPSSCHLNGSLFVENWRGVINGDVSRNDVTVNVTSDGSTWYLKGEVRLDGIVFAKWKGDPPQWRLYATFVRD